MGTKGEGNRQRIVEAAEELFCRRGYNQTSFQDISEATNIPRGNFYYYFKTKEEILNAVIDARVVELTALLTQFDNDISDPKERLLMFASRLETEGEEIVQSGCPTGTLCTELAKSDFSLHEKSKETFIVLRDWITVQFGLMGSANAGQSAMDLIARLQGINVMANVFNDAEYLNRSHLELLDWIKQQG